MKPAAWNIYCCDIDALCSCRGPWAQPWGFVVPGDVWSPQFSSTACDWKSCGRFVESLQMAVWLQISLFSCVKWGHLNAFCGQVDGLPLLPVRSVRDTEENVISTYFRTTVRFLFWNCNFIQLENYLEKLEHTWCFAFLLWKMAQTPWSRKTWVETSIGPPGRCFITLIMSPSTLVSKLQCLLMAKRQHKITLSITVTPCPLQHKPDVLTLAVVFQKTSPC